MPYRRLLLRQVRERPRVARRGVVQRLTDGLRALHAREPARVIICINFGFTDGWCAIVIERGPCADQDM